MERGMELSTLLRYIQKSAFARSGLRSYFNYRPAACEIAIGTEGTTSYSSSDI